MKKLIIIIGSMLIIILLFLAQINLLNTTPLFGVIPNVGIVFICAFGMSAGSSIGAAFGLSYGFLADIVFGRTFGIYTLLYLLIGVLSGFLNNKISKDNKLSLVLMVLIFTAFFEICTSIISVVLYKVDFNFLYLIKVIAIEEVYNMFLTYILFRPFIYFGEMINRTRDSYYLLH